MDKNKASTIDWINKASTCQPEDKGHAGVRDKTDQVGKANIFVERCKNK